MAAVEQTPSESKNPSSFVIPVDIEHGGIRMAGCGSFLAFGIVAFLVTGMLLPNTFIAGLFAILIGVIAANFLERYLKGRWKSGRVLTANSETIALTKHGEIERSVDPQLHVNILAWHFNVKRNTRVKKGWHVVSLALEQDGELVPVYTFASPDDFKALDSHNLFTKLQKQENPEKKKRDGAVHSLKRAGEQRRLYEAEVDRGIFGAELTLEQFQQYLAYLQANYPDWMISTN